jgi:hypothetical protein
MDWCQHNFFSIPTSSFIQHSMIAQKHIFLTRTYIRNSPRLSWVELMLWPTVSRPIRLGVGHPFGAHDQIFFFPFFCRTVALLFVLGLPLWREDGSVICSEICWNDRIAILQQMFSVTINTWHESIQNIFVFLPYLFPFCNVSCFCTREKLKTSPN